MGRYGVTFETKCYENDWEKILSGDYLQKMITRNQFNFAETILYINNVSDPERVSAHAQMFVDKKILTAYKLVDSHAEEALRFFNLQRDDFQGGYFYSIAELVSIYLTKTPYLLHFSGDSTLEGDFSWIDEAIIRMESDRSIKAANPVWNRRTEEARQEAVEEDHIFFKGLGFSDQCYLIKTEDFKQRIYHERHPESERYPDYGGELFEKRVDAWLRNSRYWRITYKHGSYIHPAF